MNKTFAFCIIAPALGAVVVSLILVTASYIGQGLWDLVFRSLLW